MNLVVLTGRIGAQPEIRTLNSGDKVANFSLATEERWRDRQSGEKKSRTTWHRVVTYAPGTVKFLEEYVAKGDLIQVVGMLRNEAWEDVQGQKRQATKIAVTGAGHRVEKLASPRDGAAQDEAAPEPDLDDEIPF
ncbi:MAG: single-stranded DNA-binding protein [Phenylobacterium sp.]|jgi:single-strand DNA-binding protein|uniref:single-stranded DNA-binding protein n=1 Tax=Phenylobacterium sp. TaxID=1871053 RepID=UPI001A1E322B|nr:single-stranded DNA-binding protein [Phenylobacterium sp.]MBJ7412812.1 single-stranded DNA-binding protein [Phenylobacterium sp.]